jgi:hypothetical protein
MYEGVVTSLSLVNVVKCHAYSQNLKCKAYFVVVREKKRNANRGSCRDECPITKGEVLHNLAGHDD